MKIISKYKDYYDFYVGIYGEDPLLVLDRTKNDNKCVFCGNLLSLRRNSRITLYISGFKTDGYIDKDGVTHWGDDLLKFKSDRHEYKRR